MKRTIFIIILSCFSFTFIYPQKQVQKVINKTNYIKQDKKWYLKSSTSDHFLVNDKIITLKVKGNKTYQNYKIVRKNKLGFIDIKVPDDIDIMEYYDKINDELGQDIESIEINYYAKLGYNPNDSQIANQWHLNKIKARQVWDLTFGNPSVTVAVIDYGFLWNHNDIGFGVNSYENVWINFGEDRWINHNDPTTGNRIDDDFNSFIDDLKGWDFRNNDNDVRETINHGTMVSGIIGAKTNNNFGVAGIAGGNNSEGIKIMGLNIGFDSNNVDMSVVDDAIIYAVDNGAKVINMSFGGPNEIPAINAAINYAVLNNVVLVACSMNNGFNFVYYPSSNPRVISVGGSDRNDSRASFAQYGQQLDVVAPAVDVYSTISNNGYGSDTGTSFAAPQVAAIAALIFSVRPDLTGQQVRDVIEQTAQKVGGYSYTTTAGRPNGTWHQEMGYGLVNAHAAVYAVAPRISGPSTICDQATYTITNFPEGATVQWSVSYPLEIISGQGTDSVLIESDYSGSSGVPSTIYANITLNNQSISIPHIIHSDVPEFDYFDYTEPYYVNESLPIKAYFLGANNYTWTKISGDISFEYVPGDPSRVFVNIFSDKAIRIRVTAYNSCGYWFEELMLYPERQSYFSLFPNPANELVTISFDDTEIKTERYTELNKFVGANNQPYTIQLWSSFGLVKTVQTDQPEYQLDLTGVAPGFYYVHVIKDGHTYRQQLVVQ